jgi:hypothetical protein
MKMFFKIGRDKDLIQDERKKKLVISWALKEIILILKNIFLSKNIKHLFIYLSQSRIINLLEILQHYENSSKTIIK